MARAVARVPERISKGKGRAVERPAKVQKQTRRRPSTSSNDSDTNSDSGSGSGSGSEDGKGDQSAMLAALQAHSRALLGIDGPEDAESSIQAQRRLSHPSDEKEEEEGEDDEDDEEEEGEEFQSDDGWGAEDDFVTDSEDGLGDITGTGNPNAKTTKKVVEDSGKKSKVPEVVFAPQTNNSVDVLSKAERRAFLMGNSSKMMGIKRQEEEYVGRKRPRNDADDDDDQSKLRLDKSLHEMLVTNLLSTAATSEAKRPVDKRNAIEGRLLELASYAPTGLGSKSALSTSSTNLSSHPAKIRTGIIQAQAKRDEKARKEAEASGNKVRGMAGLGDSGGGGKRNGGGERDRAMMGAELNKKKGMESRKKGDAARDRGLGMGIGRFDRGMLKLSEREIARGSEERRGGRGGGRGGRGRGGRGGGGGGGGRGGGGGKRGRR